MPEFLILALSAPRSKGSAMELLRRLVRHRRRRRELRRQRAAQYAYEAHLARPRPEPVTFDVFGPGSRPR